MDCFCNFTLRVWWLDNWGKHQRLSKCVKRFSCHPQLYFNYSLFATTTTCSNLNRNRIWKIGYKEMLFLWSAVICLRELLHLVSAEKRQRMSNNYQSHLVRPQSWCSCVTSPPNPHIWSAKWAPELRAALPSFEELHHCHAESPSPISSAALSSVTTVDVKWERSLLGFISFLNDVFSHSTTALICPGDTRSLVFKAVMLTAETTGGGGVSLQELMSGQCGWDERPLGCLTCVLSLYINLTFLDSCGCISEV